MTSLLLQELKHCVGGIGNEEKHGSDNEDENESGNPLSDNIRLSSGYNLGPQKGTVTGFHILR